MKRQANAVTDAEHTGFQSINKGYDALFKPGQLSIGLVAPLAAYHYHAVPDLFRHMERIQLAEELGFSAVWLRDVPFNVPAFGDAGQQFDPFVYLGTLAAKTEHIALGVASIILPLRHPAHVAKASASVEVLSQGRLVLGVASGDRPEEYPALNIPFAERGVRFRESFEYIRNMHASIPMVENKLGVPQSDMEVLPKLARGKLPMLITGGSQQGSQWLAQRGDGWMIYPRNPKLQAAMIQSWRENLEALSRTPQPVMQPVYIDLVEDDNASPQPIHLGFRSGLKYLIEYLTTIQDIGVNHVALNLRFNHGDIETTMQRLSKEVLPRFKSI